MRRVALLAVMTACVPSITAIESPVRATVRARVGLTTPADVSALIAQPITRDAAIQIALARDPRGAQAMAELGIAAGELGARRGLGRTDLDVEYRTYGYEPGIDLAVVHDVIDLVVARPNRAAGAAMVAAAQARASAALIEIAATAELGWLEVAAASAQVALARTRYNTDDAAAELTDRIRDAGGTTALAKDRADTARELARLELTRAQTDLAMARARFAAQLGLTEPDWKLAAGLPPVPDAAPDDSTLEATALAQSLALAALTDDTLAARNDARAATITSWLPGLGIGGVAQRAHDRWTFGTALRIGLPLVSGDRGAAASARARTRVASAAVVTETVELRVAARAAQLEAAAAFAEARHLTDVVVPLTKRVVVETLRQYNAMNASPFELLLARRDQAQAEAALIAAQLRFARARVAVAALRAGVAITAPSARSEMPTIDRGGSHASP